MTPAEQNELTETAVIIGAWAATMIIIWGSAALAEFLINREEARAKAAAEEAERIAKQAQWNLEAAARRAAWERRSNVLKNSPAVQQDMQRVETIRVSGAEYWAAAAKTRAAASKPGEQS